MREEALRQLLRKLNINHEPVNKKGWMNAVCPFAPWLHKNGSDKTPSFGVIVDETGPSSFKCWGCKQHGTVNKLIRLLSAYRREDYDAILEESRGLERSGRVYANFDEAPPGPEWEEIEALEDAIWDGLFDDPFEHRICADYLTERGVSKETCDRLGIQYDTEKRRVIFPVKGARGELYGFTGRAVYPKPKVKVLDYAGLPKKHLILGRERWVPGKPVVIVEGLFAFAHFHEIGVEEFANIGALLGSEMTDGKAMVLRDFGETVCLVLDPDEAGDAGTFGSWDEAAKRHNIESSSIGKLWGHVPLIVPDYPEMDEPDPDNLTKEDVRSMVAERLWKPNPQQAKALKGAGLGW